EKVEPLSTIATDALFELSRIKKFNIVACPTDMMTMGGGIFGIKEPKPASFLAMTFPYQVNVTIDNSWLILKPSEPGYTRASRADRAALGAYLRTAVKEGRLSLENRANYAFRAGEEDQGYTAMFSLAMLGVVDKNFSYGGDWEALKLYGSLSPTQRAAAKNATPIPFRQLRPEQTEILRHMIFDNAYSRLSVNWDQQDIAEASNGEENQILGGGLEQEATELLPNGFTGQEILTITDSSQPRFFGSPENEGNQNIIWGEQAFDENSLAFELFQQEKPEFFPWRNQPGMDRKPPSKYRMGNERRVAFNSKLTRRATLDMQVTDKSYTSEAMALEKLPGDVKKRVDEALARYREQYKNMKPSDFNAPTRGNIIPPPRR
ncbi:MAG TPA: hypothetical protein VJ835_04990, partial [Fimbriimonadaceae bacterium]|nr:hypothetical protein [Fimbriimonadaceae bacterium]